MKTIDIKSASAAELLAFYNANSGKNPVKRFSDRKTAERRVGELLAAMPAKKVEAASPDRAAAIAESWKNKDVAARRAARHGVRVTDPKGRQDNYKSVRQAFLELGLPIGCHIKFRGALKAEGKREFNGYKFELV